MPKEFKYDFSLVIATYGRCEDLTDMLNSLVQQRDNVKFEVIIVDQNKKGCLDNIIEPFNLLLDIKHIYEEKGLSKSRNSGLRIAQGKYITFPDDDCSYPLGLLDNVFNRLEEKKEDILSIKCLDFDGSDSMGKWSNISYEINHKNVWTSAVSIGIFLKKENAIIVNGFNESLGVGCNTKYQSGEESDFLIRLLDKNKKIYYYPKLYINHPKKDNIDTMLLRAFPYACGFGKVLSINNYSIFFKLKVLIRPIGGMLLNLCNKKYFKFYLDTFWGRLIGMLNL